MQKEFATKITVSELGRGGVIIVVDVNGKSHMLFRLYLDP